ncbi:hypothetical protein D0Z07_4854 [Hyphodiscus hymeniophilus]|uniref:Ams2/SPT21 N-terminal domain-containing protein n=1 Tax=Hyphodiscus hymeniophilus TaxID=353542 RepID=A0A9P7AX36_9HELO|nr:hypothetical protein D0Z07_4854 [Hyphodiscus hymeniophilus]
MSSPGPSQWQTEQSQGPPANASIDADEDGVSIRPMRQLVVQSSPELIARLGQDYTIYAYDYSEYDTPLVGQGMLSRALAASAFDAPAQQNQKLITGRVCKNILGIFNNGVKETLEVKLRLVSVPTAVQGEYNNQMEKYREMTRTTGFDPSEWAAFLQSNPSLGQVVGATGSQNQKPPSRSGSMNLEVVNQLLSPSLSQPQIDPLNQVNAENYGNESNGSVSNGKVKNTSRPSSRVSVKRPRKPRQPKDIAIGGNTSGYEEGTDGDDGPVPKKRAKTTKADWNNKSSFGPVSDSLRVTASTAGSLRMFRPIAIAANTPGHLQEIPRAPTPVPALPKSRGPRLGKSCVSTSRRGSTVSQIGTPRISPTPHLDPAGRQEDEIRLSIESVGPSPERQSPAETTPDIGSSPPVMRTLSPMQSSPPCPSSPPILPQMRRNDTDSGFMSGITDDLFGEGNEEMRPIDEDDGNTALKYSRRDVPPPTDMQDFEIQMETPGPVELLPATLLYIPLCPKGKSATYHSNSRAGSVMSEDGQQTLPPLKNGRPCSRNSTPSRLATEVQIVHTRDESHCNDTQFVDFTESRSNIPQNVPQQSSTHDTALQVDPSPAPVAAYQSRSTSRTMVRTASMGSLTLPTIPASDPVRPPSNLQRSQTCYANVPPPDLPTIAEVNRAQALEAKKAAMRQKIDNAIANGIMPPFCMNCGAIETPTWRKAWSQDVVGAPPYYEYSDEPGKVTMVTILSRDEEGNPTSYQLIKKFLLKGEDEKTYNEVILCNPCGLWVSKYKMHRPEDRWECNKNKKPAEKKKAVQRPAKSKKPKSIGNMNPTSEANHPQSDYPQSEANNPQSEAIGQTEENTQTEQPGRRQSVDARPIKRLHPMTSDAASAALRRALKSSPARWVGTVHSPIDVEEEEDLGSTRRLLFPSPRKDGSPKVLGEVVTNVVTTAPDFRSLKEAAMELPNKENCPPPLVEDECDPELLKLFEEEMARPSTPKGNSPTQSPFKTPTRPTPTHRPITRSVSRSIQSAKSPAQLLFFQKTPVKTPNSAACRRSPRNHNHHFESPFTATLNQIMSDANDHHSPSRGLHLDFSSLPELPELDGPANTANYTLEDFFSTDVPMPSSPPRMGFHLYADPLTMSNINWSDFDVAMLGNDPEGESMDHTIKKEPGIGEDSEESSRPVEGSEEQL